MAKTKRAKYRNSSYLVSVALILSGCFGCSDKWSIELWEQKIEGSSFSVYKFDAWGGRDSHVSGLKIKDSSKGFTQNDVLHADGFSTFKTIPRRDLIEAIKPIRPEYGKMKSHVPVSIDTFLVEGIQIIQETYLYDGSVQRDCGLQAYDFQAFEETRDSLVFYDNVSQFVNEKGYKRISVPKGNIYLMTSEDNKYVARVVYEDILIVKDPSTNNGIKICSQMKTFDPTDSTKISAFSDYGIFKPVK